MITVLLGAGASKAFGASNTGLRMPLAKDFFQTYRKLAIYDNPWVIRGKLLRYIQTVYGVEPESFLAGEIDIEQIHSEIESNLLAAIREDRKMEWIFLHGVFMELCSIFACVVNTIGQGPVSPAHQSLARHLSPQDAVVTFNWDTLMDLALESETGWTVDRGYGFLPRQVFRNEWLSPSPASFEAPQLLKLHGSSNWLTSYSTISGRDFSLTQTSPSEAVWVVEDATKPFDCFAGRFMPGYGRLTFGYYPPNLRDDPGKSAPEGYVRIQGRPKHPHMPEGAAGDAGLVSAPLIIPPVRDKKYELYGHLFKGLWADAQNAITRADLIIVIGYSFPITDQRSRDLFKRAFIGRNSIPEVVILDPSPTRTEEVFRWDLGIPSSRLKIIREPFTEDFDLGKLGI